MGCEFWFGAWLKEHQLRFSTKEWIKADSPRAAIWLEEFERQGVQESEAVEASRRLAYLAEMGKLSSRRRDSHLGLLITHIRRNRARAQGAVNAVESREIAEAQSRDCVECGGGGLTRRKIPMQGHPEPVSVACYCHRCPMGRWMKAKHAEDESTRGRILDLIDHESLQTKDEPEPGTLRAWDRGRGAFVAIAEIGRIPAPPTEGADASRSKFEEWRRQRDGAASPF